MKDKITIDREKVNSVIVWAYTIDDVFAKKVTKSLNRWKFKPHSFQDLKNIICDSLDNKKIESIFKQII